MRTYFCIVVAFLFLTMPMRSFATDTDVAARAGFKMPVACAGASTPMLNILGQFFILRLYDMQALEAKYANEVDAAKLATSQYGAICPAFAKNPNSPTLLATHNSLHDAVGSAMDSLSDGLTKLRAQADLIDRKYSSSFGDSACLKAIKSDAAHAVSMQTTAAVNVAQKEQACGGK